MSNKFSNKKEGAVSVASGFFLRRNSIRGMKNNGLVGLQKSITFSLGTLPDSSSINVDSNTDTQSVQRDTAWHSKLGGRLTSTMVLSNSSNSSEELKDEVRKKFKDIGNPMADGDFGDEEVG